MWDDLLIEAKIEGDVEGQSKRRVDPHAELKGGQCQGSWAWGRLSESLFTYEICYQNEGWTMSID